MAAAGLRPGLDESDGALRSAEDRPGVFPDGPAIPSPSRAATTMRRVAPMRFDARRRLSDRSAGRRQFDRQSFTDDFELGWTHPLQPDYSPDDPQRPAVG